jgi:uncharacterized membrane protein
LIRKHIFPEHRPAGSAFYNRGQEIKRIETFSDAVFAFGITLLIVSLEVPKTFEELFTSMRGFFAFGICFSIVMLIWHEQHVFFRRYGLDDNVTLVLNSMLLFIVLFYVYPLKFLMTLVFSEQIYGPGKSPFSSVTDDQVLKLMVIYGFGYIIIYTVFFLLYLHAFRTRNALDLSPHEVFDTRTKMYKQAILVAIGVCSIFLAWMLPERLAGFSGYLYMVIGPAFWIFFSKRAKMRRTITD